MLKRAEKNFSVFIFIFDEYKIQKNSIVCNNDTCLYYHLCAKQKF